MRHEIKFCISTRDVPAIADTLSRVMSADAHADSSGGYDIRSLYFDDEYKTAYYDKLAGVPNRVKYRLRAYNGSFERVYLERKRKIGDVVDKKSCALSRSLAERFIAGFPDGYFFSQSGEVFNDAVTQMIVKRLRPVVIVDYRRQAFVHEGGNTRVTIDTRVRSGAGNIDMFDKNLLTVEAMDPAMSILEVKYDLMLPDFISSAISRFSGARSAMSKYVMCCRYAI